MKTTLSITLSILFSYNINAQGCFEDNLILRTQDDIEEFANTYPNCKIIEGDLYIGNPNGMENIVDLGPLSNLEEVKGDLRIISNPLLANLNGLDNITIVGMDLELASIALTNIDGISNITSVGDDLEIVPSSNMAILDGFNNLTSVGDDVFIGSSSVQEVAGFSQLAFVSGDIFFDDLPQLTSLENGFPMLDSIGGKLSFNEVGFQQFSGFDNLVKIQSLEIQFNPNLVSLSGLEQLIEIHGTIRIRYNDQLTSLDGLDNIDVEYLPESNQAAALLLVNNPVLSFCGQDFVCRMLKKLNTTVTLLDNGEGCSDYDHLYYNLCRVHVCYPNNLQITSQTEIDSFFQNHPKCTLIEGDLIIGDPNGNVNDIITNLDGFESIDSVFGNIIISNNKNLTSLTGLKYAKFLNGDLRIINNRNLKEIDLLRWVGHFGGDIEIANNQKFETLINPIDVNVIEGSFILSNNASVEEIDELDDLVYIGGDMIIENNDEFLRMGRMEELSIIGGDLVCRDNDKVTLPYWLTAFDILGGDWIIENNPMLTTLPLILADTIIGDLVIRDNALITTIFTSSLETLGGSFVIEGNINLGSIGVPNLTFIGNNLIIKDAGNLNFQALNTFELFEDLNGNLILDNNAKLESLDGLQWLDPNKVDRIEITNNPMLTTCHIGAICQKLLNDPTDVIINGNAGTCENNEIKTLYCDPGVCFEAEADLWRQEEIDKFVKAAHGCSVLEGPLSVRSSSGNELDITDLGFLKVVNGDVDLKSHPFGDNLQIGAGLRNLEHVGGNFFYNVDNEIDFRSFTNLEKIEGRFQMWSDAIESFRGLEKLKQVGSLQLFSSERVRNFEGLEGLKSIKETLQISFADSLSSLKGLENVEYVGNRIQISGDLLLTDIYAINHVDPRDLEDLTLSSPVLTDCNLKLFCEFLFLNPDYEFLLSESNEPGCSDISELNCEDYGLSGYVFFDANTNGIKDVEEFGVPNISVQMNLANRILKSNERGKYISYLEEGQAYEIEVDAGPDWSLSTPSEVSGVFAIQDSNVFDVGLIPNFERHTSLVSISSDNIRCNESGRYFLTLQNTGTFIESGEIHFDYDQAMTFVSSSRVPTSHDVDEAILIWEYSNFYPFESMEIELEFTMPNQNFAGQLLESQLIQYYEDNDSPFVLGEFINQELVRCAYDPNDKQIDPPGIGEEGYILRDESVVYTLRFQNTGNDYARNVRLTDTLSSIFDLESFELLNASHNVYTHLDGNVLTFYFDDIYLIDSLSSPRESQGHVSFRISMNEDTPDFTIVENNADIYFDSNEPIKTNTVSNTVVEKYLTQTIDQENLEPLIIFPNPTNGIVQITFKSKGLLQIYDSTSKIINELVVDHQEYIHKVDLGQMHSGVYYVHFSGESGIQYLTKIFKH